MGKLIKINSNLFLANFLQIFSNTRHSLIKTTFQIAVIYEQIACVSKDSIVLHILFHNNYIYTEKGHGLFLHEKLNFSSSQWKNHKFDISTVFFHGLPFHAVLGYSSEKNFFHNIYTQTFCPHVLLLYDFSTLYS